MVTAYRRRGQNFAVKNYTANCGQTTFLFKLWALTG